MFKNKKRLALAFTIFALLTGGVFFWKATVTYGVTDDEESRQSYRNALSELNLSTRSNAAEIAVSSNNLANFIYYRSGIRLSQANKDSLMQSEQKAWAESKRITQSQLADAMTTVAYEKLATFSDAI